MYKIVISGSPEIKPKTPYIQRTNASRQHSLFFQ